MWKSKRLVIEPEVAALVARSAVVMSRNNLGGCVVLVRTDDFEPYLHHESIAWEAPVFDGLIEALFAWRPTSLGAVLVRGRRVVYRQASPKVDDEATWQDMERRVRESILERVAAEP